MKTYEGTVYHRVKRGLSLETALSRPIDVSKSNGASK